jgi:hypothetical protein
VCEMSCCNACGQTIVVDVPGVAGQNGAAGAAGSNGVNAFTITTSDFVLPAANSNVTVLVANSTWMAIGQNLFISDGTNIGNFQVVSFPNNASVVLEFLDYTGDTAPGATVSAGAMVSPSGLQGPAESNTFANGKTTGTTKATAQTNLGLGQNAITSNSSALAQVITNAFVEVGTCDVAVSTPGLYLILAKAIVTMAGVTFAASRTITLRVRNITQGTTIATADFPTQILTTQNEPALELAVPFITDAAAVANDHYQLQITIDTANSAGTLAVQVGSLVAVPLRFT